MVKTGFTGAAAGRERSAVLFVCVVLAGAAASCAGLASRETAVREGAAMEQNVLARVDGEPITGADFLRALGRVPAAYREKYLTPEGKRQLLRSLIEDDLFYEEGCERGIDSSPEVEAAVEDFRKRIVREKVSDDLKGKVRIGPEDVERYYSENTGKYTVPEKLRLSIIMIPLAKDAPQEKVQEAEEKARDIIERVRGGEEFEWLAAQLSAHSSAEKGGDLGFQSISDIPPDIVDVAQALPSVGEVSGPVRGELGIYIIKLTGLQPETVVPLEDARPDIEAILLKKAHDDAFKELLERLERAADIEVDDAAVESMNLKQEEKK